MILAMSTSATCYHDLQLLELLQAGSDEEHETRQVCHQRQKWFLFPPVHLSSEHTGQYQGRPSHQCGTGLAVRLQLNLSYRTCSAGHVGAGQGRGLLTWEVVVTETNPLHRIRYPVDKEKEGKPEKWQ